METEKIRVGAIVEIDGRRARVLTPPYTTLGVLDGSVHDTVTVEALDNGELGRFPVAQLEEVR